MAQGGRWARKYSDEQQRAVARCVLELGISAKKAVEHVAEHGYDGEEPFTISVDTAKKAATIERRRRAGQKIDRRFAQLTPEKGTADTIAASHRIIAHHLDRLERRAERGRLTTADIDQGKRLTEWARQVSALAAGAVPSTSSGRGARKQTDHRPPEAKTPDAAAEAKRRAMLEELKAAGTNGNTHTHIGTPPEGAGSEASDSGAQPPDHAVSVVPSPPGAEPSTQAATPPRA